jgi:DNA-binding GntR family transcriptional regulator
LEKEGMTLTPTLSHKWEREIMRRFHIAKRTLEKALKDLRDFGFPLMRE